MLVMTDGNRDKATHITADVGDKLIAPCGKSSAAHVALEKAIESADMAPTGPVGLAESPNGRGGGQVNSKLRGCVFAMAGSD